MKHTLNTKLLGTILLSGSLLSGCTPYAETFDCPASPGVGCRSLSEVNHIIEQGDLPLKPKKENISKDNLPLIEASANSPASRQGYGRVSVLSSNTKRTA